MQYTTWGGGTFDVSILRIVNGIFEVLATNGDTYLGGDDFDRALVGLWLSQHRISQEEYVANKELAQQLRLTAESAKKHLSMNETFSAELNGKTLTMGKTEFEQLIQPDITKTIECCENALKDAGLKNSDIDEIIMVGGIVSAALSRRKT